jgi:hypothetical protein
MISVVIVLLASLESAVKRRLICVSQNLASTEHVLIAFISTNAFVIQDGVVLHAT